MAMNLDFDIVNSSQKSCNTKIKKTHNKEFEYDYVILANWLSTIILQSSSPTIFGHS